MVGGRTGALARAVRQVALVERHVLDADDAFVDLEFGDAIDEEERIAVRQNPFDRRVIEGQRQVHYAGLYAAPTV